MLGPALERLRVGGVEVDVVETRGAGDATRIAREAYGRGRRRFIAVGGDGTSYEVVNGLFPERGAVARHWQGERGRPSHTGVLAAGDGEFFFARFQRPRGGTRDRVADCRDDPKLAMCCGCGTAAE